MSNSALERDETDSESPGAPAWVVTFGDMMSLLLTFFVLLLSFSEIDAVKYRALSDSFRVAFGLQKEQQLFTQPQTRESLSPNQNGSKDSILEELNSIIPQSFPGAPPGRKDGQGLLFSVPGRLLFDSGRDELKPELRSKLKEIANVVKKRRGLTMQVEGHSDDVPIHTPRFLSNWELSAARAIAVIRFFIEECQVPAERLAAAGYADSHPLVPNDSEENREKNRRVEFRFIDRSDIQ